MKTGRHLSVMAVALCTSMATPLAAQTAPTTAEELAEMRAELKAMADRIKALEAELQLAEAQTATNVQQTERISEPVSGIAEAQAEQQDTTISWKGAPVIESESGWSFKPRGRLMYDAGWIYAPDMTGADNGFGNEVRRARLGVQGDVPGGFGYKFELDFAGNEVEVNDAIISYEDGDLELAIGQHNNFQGLEELTSSLHTTFIERAAFTDAFGFERRIGASATYKSGIVLAQAGAFTDNFDDTSTDNRGVDARVVIMPKFGAAQAHFGASVHYTDLQQPDATVRYRQRPLVHFTSDRFISTGQINATSEFNYGFESAIINGPFHAAAEGHWQRANRTAGFDDASFFGGYAEVGYFFTKGDTRGYKSGTFDRVKPSNPVGDGGIGSVQFNLRYDHLDLNDGDIIGGQQDGYFASLIWKPTAYTLLMLNYGRLEYTEAVLPALAGDVDYSVDVVGMRAQIDF